MFQRLRLASAVVSFSLLAAFATPVRAQCVPDGLDAGPCCQQAGVVLPQFPARAQGVSYICFDGCQPTSTFSYCASIGAPVPLQLGGALVCGAYQIRIKLRNCGTPTDLWNGTVNAAYSRNWQAASSSGGVNLTIWRFLINGDFLPTAALPNNPCQRPACAAAFQRVYFTGYIDYAFDCVNGGWQVAFMLTHECDGIHHAAGTVRPAPAAGFHPSRSFTIVGPGATFVPSSTTPIRSNGPIGQQALRWNNWAAAPSICTFEEAATGTFQALNEFCMCSTAGVNQYIATNVSASGACGSKVNPAALGPFMQKRIGRWTSSTTYPGNQFLFFDFGYLSYTNGCVGTATLEWYEGVETIRGYPAIDFTGVALGSQFEDLGSSNRSATNAAIRIGAPHLSYSMLNFNLP